MGWLLLAFVALIAVFTLLAYFVGRLISGYLQHHIEERLDALDQIVNEGRVPDSWLKPFRRRAARLRKAGASERRIRRLERAARKQCLIRIEELQRYAGGSGVADTEDTRHLIVTSLQEEAERWRDDEAWHELVDFTQPERVVVRDDSLPRSDEADWNGRD